MDKIRVNDLTGKMVCYLVQGIAVGLFLLSLLYFGGKGFLQQYFLKTGYFYEKEVGRAEELQKYVDENCITTTDYEQLRKWATERNIDDFTISRNGWLLFDVAYDGMVMPGSKKITNFRWKVYHKIVFEDGEAEVYLYEGFADKYYDILLAISIVLGFAACIGIFVSEIHKDVKYIQCLKREIDVISQGDLQGNVTIQGTDEISQLASGLEHMRKTLIKKEEIEQEMRLAQEKLVLGMSHDLRTPLTGLIAYIEILKKQQKEGNVTQEYIEKAFDKVLQIRSLSDQMFEYFFVNSEHKIELEPEETIMSALGDYLSELCALLECEGFLVNADKLEWKPIFVQINTDFLGRIMNNLISNLEKYGERGKEVQIQLCYEENKVGISIQNAIARTATGEQKTGIGLQNILAMMKQMNGYIEVQEDEEIYCIVLYFPIIKN